MAEVVRDSCLVTRLSDSISRSGANEDMPLVVIIHGLRYKESNKAVSDYARGFRGLGLRGLLRNALARIIYRLLWRPNA